MGPRRTAAGEGRRRRRRRGGEARGRAVEEWVEVEGERVVMC